MLNLKANGVLNYNSVEVIGAVSKMKYAPCDFPSLTFNTVSNRQYLDYFHIDAADAAGGIGTVTVLIYGMVSLIYHKIDVFNRVNKLQHTIGQPS